MAVSDSTATDPKAFLDYCAWHCRTERAIFSRKQLEDLFEMAGEKPDVELPEWISAYADVVLPLVEKAEARLASVYDPTKAPEIERALTGAAQVEALGKDNLLLRARVQELEAEAARLRDTLIAVAEVFAVFPNGAVVADAVPKVRDALERVRVTLSSTSAGKTFLDALQSLRARAQELEAEAAVLRDTLNSSVKVDAANVLEEMARAEEGRILAARDGDRFVDSCREWADALRSGAAALRRIGKDNSPEKRQTELAALYLKRAHLADTKSDKYRAELERAINALQKINEIRNSIVSLQAIDWSEHIYPLVAALNDAGLKGKPYPADRAYLGSVIEQRDAALVRVRELEAEIASKDRLPTPVPIEDFGKDHWSTFAYIETCCVDNRGVPDHARMRTDPDLHPGIGGCGVSTEKYPTRLRGYFLSDGKVDQTKALSDHDDWSCVQDMVDAGLLLRSGTAVNPVFKLTEKGLAIAGQLRAHKARGGSFSTFVPEVPR